MGFEDTWTYSAFLMQDFKGDPRNSELFELIDSLHRILGPSEMMAYLLMMAPRLLELHRKLKKTGSLYLHCDPVASHYLKIILDVIFGPENFRNEITWKRQSAHSDAKHQFSNVSDTLLFYVKSNKAQFRPVYVAHDPKYIADFYRFDDGDGRGLYRLSDAGSPNPRPNMMYVYKGYECPPKGWRFELKTMERLDGEGRLHLPKRPDGSPDLTKRISLKRYLSEQAGSIVTNVWTDIPPLQSSRHPGSEARGYPTQKPLALLERIIAASTDEGDVVLDPFAGCGTAMVAAERMNRKWIGIDITYLAINEVVARLNEEKHQDRDLVYELLGTPKDEDAAKALFQNTEKQNHKPFEQWAVTLVGGKYNEKAGADRGKDGVIQLWDLSGSYREGIIQVKGGNSLNLSNVRDFAHVIENNKAVFGIMIAQKEPTKEMKLIAEQMGYADWPGQRKIPRYQILSTEGILERGEQAIVPDSYLIGPDKGVGKAVKTQTENLFEEE